MSGWDSYIIHGDTCGRYGILQILNKSSFFLDICGQVLGVLNFFLLHTVQKSNIAVSSTIALLSILCMYLYIHNSALVELSSLPSVLLLSQQLPHMNAPNVILVLNCVCAWKFWCFVDACNCMCRYVALSMNIMFVSRYNF